MSKPAGWYPDPKLGSDRVRWWDGVQWTERVQPPLPPAPTHSRSGALHAILLTIGILFTVGIVVFVIAIAILLPQVKFGNK